MGPRTSHPKVGGLLALPAGAYPSKLFPLWQPFRVAAFCALSSLLPSRASPPRCRGWVLLDCCSTSGPCSTKESVAPEPRCRGPSPDAPLGLEPLWGLRRSRAWRRSAVRRAVRRSRGPDRLGRETLASRRGREPHRAKRSRKSALPPWKGRRGWRPPCSRSPLSPPRGHAPPPGGGFAPLAAPGGVAWSGGEAGCARCKQRMWPACRLRPLQAAFAADVPGRSWTSRGAPKRVAFCLGRALLRPSRGRTARRV